MPDEFVSLTDCADGLPAAKVVDRIPFYRFVSLNIASENGEVHEAIFPPDHAFPQLFKEYAIDGWPPEDIVGARGGLPLVSDWEEPPEEGRVAPANRVTITDVDSFLADPEAAIDVRLSSANVETLLST